jgi:hypothetical protein
MEHIHRAELMFRVLQQKVRKQRLSDGSERAKRLEIAGASAITPRMQSFNAADALVGNQDVSELAPESAMTFDHSAIENHASAQAGADHGRDGSGSSGGPEDIEMTPERGGVAVVQVSDGPVKELLELA